MSAQGVIVLLLWLSCCGSALWRYKSNSPHYSIFSTRTTILLEYEGTTFSEWSVPEACSLKNKKSPKTELRCSSPGIHAIKPIVTGPDVDDERFLLVDSSHICFHWYYKYVDHFHNLSQAVTIWIYDPESADPKELEWIADKPSLNSKILTKQLAILGQKPVIYTFLNKKLFYAENEMIDGTWRMILPMAADDVLKEIRGTQVTFQDCFIADFLFMLPIAFFTMPEIPGDLPLTAPPGSQIIADWIECLPSSGIVVSEVESYHTNNSFRTWTRIRVPPNILADAERQNVSSVVLSEDGIFFLINGILYLKSYSSFEKLGAANNIPNEIKGIISRKWCLNRFLLKFKPSRSSLAIWTRDEVYLGYEKLKFVKIFTTAGLQATLQVLQATAVYIHTVEYTVHPLEIAFFIEYHFSATKDKKIYLALYNEDSEALKWQPFLLTVSAETVLTSSFIYSAVPEFLMWDKHMIYYYYENFAFTGIIETSSKNVNLSKEAEDSTIHDIFLDYYGDIVVKMTNNIMFYFRDSSTDAIKLHLWINKNTKSIMYLNTVGYVCLLSVFNDGTTNSQEYPLKLELESAVFKLAEKCPYMAFQHNIFNLFYFMDKGKSLIFWAQIVYPENTGLRLLVDSYGPNIFEKEYSTHYEIASGYCTKTIVMNFYHNKDYGYLNNYYKQQRNTMGLVLLHIKPSEHAKSCPKSLRVFQIAVGCDPAKYLSVRGYKRDGCLQHDFYYIIKKEYLRNKTSTNLRAKYMWDEYGCPLKFNIKENFQPILELNNEDGFLEQVKVNFILWEIHGRNDYSYNYTMAQSGCLNEAQSWQSMTEQNQNLSLDEVWGPENYKPCFSYIFGKPGNLHQPYEIINSSNNNHLVWPTDHIGLYVFRVKILDPNYSFCNLSVIFAVETYGVFPSPNAYMVASVLFIIILLFFTILFLSYFHYMMIYRKYIYNPPHRNERKQSQ
ncbi:cation channel sperm-associated auxiliary subunit epsilon [Erinaceus europaeus]|uniref:Cation channel sperm-associated auxiliary subunit epsilon n=1 Tax=Erinaceus europaeus TaxID=9365 RepID=A0A1S3AHB0_ERIEU|nr:cation channel sperm-associated auxiliary subunit epsilon [Erinaceus europaeus]